jgi:hypothetical protein
MYHQSNIQQFYVLPTQSVYVFCMDLRINSDYFSIRHSLTGFSHQNRQCLIQLIPCIVPTINQNTPTYRALCPQSTRTPQHTMHCAHNQPEHPTYAPNRNFKSYNSFMSYVVYFDYLEMQCVYCEVRTETLYIIQINLSVSKST